MTGKKEIGKREKTVTEKNEDTTARSGKKGFRSQARRQKEYHKGRDAFLRKRKNERDMTDSHHQQPMPRG